MPDGFTDLPLFPLETVLFPHAELRLHIFEDRYRQMVRACIENGTTFGIVLIRSGFVVDGPAEPFMVGTQVSITSAHTYADGKIDLHLHGVDRFRIRKLDDSSAVLHGQIEVLNEDPVPDTEHAAEVVAEAKEAFERLVRRILSRPDFAIQVQFPPDPTELSFAIANLLHFDTREKQLLLEMTDTIQRLECLLPKLESQLEMETDDEIFQVVEASRVHQVTHEELSQWSGPN